MTIGQLLFEHDEAKRQYQAACQAIIKCAIDNGMDKRSAEDVRLSMAYLKGVTRRKQ